MTEKVKNDLIVTSSVVEYVDSTIGAITRKNVLFDINGDGIKDCKGSSWNCVTCSCLVLYTEKENLIEDLTSSTPGHGKILLRYVLKVLKSESNYIIRLVDLSSVSIPGDDNFPLCYIIQIKAMTNVDAIRIMKNNLTKYPWLSHIINHLKLSHNNNLMIDSIKNPPFDFSSLVRYNLYEGLQEVFQFKFYTD